MRDTDRISLDGDSDIARRGSGYLSLGAHSEDKMSRVCNIVAVFLCDGRIMTGLLKAVRDCRRLVPIFDMPNRPGSRSSAPQRRQFPLRSGCHLKPG
jgi:hypothetical protein